jgi:hypothetical protein
MALTERQPFESELQTPTVARMVPKRIEYRNSFSPTNTNSSAEAKLGYITLNIPAPWPPRSVFPVNTGAQFGEHVLPQYAWFALTIVSPNNS